MANYKGRCCFVIAGLSSVTLNSVSRYNIAEDQWELGTPDLNVGRVFASACSIRDSVFVFAGINKSTYLNSVERLKVPQIYIGAVWELISLPEEVFASRLFPVVVPLNESDIAVLGGKDSKVFHKDVVVYNVTSKACRKVADLGDNRFTAENN